MLPNWDFKSLRTQFLDQHRDASQQMLNAAAHMLIEIDRQDNVAQIGLDYLATILSVARVDIGFGSHRADSYSAAAEYLDDGAFSILNVAFPNKSSVLQRVWHNKKPVAYDDIKNNPLIDDNMKKDFTALGTRAMLAQRLESENNSFGIICIDDLETDRAWQQKEQNFVLQFCRDFFGPILGISRRIRKTKKANRPSPAELDAIRLAAQGLSYKQIAATLNKSIRTVEFQFRNARAKTGANNQTELVGICQHWL